MSIPAGFTADGLPVGLELLGPAFTEPTLFKVAFAYERVMQPRRPPASTPPLR
jgi:Asp-tRNA(Asn)/Glu-tRNA(Gln) amidotransferase A subunit family amidase